GRRVRRMDQPQIRIKRRRPSVFAVFDEEPEFTRHFSKIEAISKRARHRFDGSALCRHRRARDYKFVRFLAGTESPGYEPRIIARESRCGIERKCRRRIRKRGGDFESTRFGIELYVIAPHKVVLRPAFLSRGAGGGHHNGCAHGPTLSAY